MFAMAPVFPIPLHVIAQVLAQPVVVRLDNIGAMDLVLLIILIAIQPAELMPADHRVKALAADGASLILRHIVMARATQLLANQIL